MGEGAVIDIQLLVGSILYMLPLKQFGNLLSFQRSCMFLPFFMMGFFEKSKRPAYYS